jgi:hypothetical protein
MLAQLALARLSAFVILTTVVAPAWAVYSAEYSGSASSQAGASTSQNVAPFDAHADNPDDVFDYAPNSSAAVLGSTILNANAGAGSAFSSASFMATAGGVHVGAVASATAGGSPGWGSGASSFSTADAVSYDSFIVTAAGYAPGTVFTVHASVYMTGSVGAMGFRSPSGGEGSYDAVSSWQAEVHIANETMLFPLQQQASSNCWDSLAMGPGCGGAAFSTLNLLFTVANGETTDLALVGHVRSRSSAGANGEALAGADAWADLGHTIGWGGISSVLDDAGNPIGTYTALSATSGFDYRNAYVSAVPEPRIAVLLFTGILVVLFAGGKVHISYAGRTRKE